MTDKEEFAARSQLKWTREGERIIERHIVPTLGARAMSEVGRGDITTLLDRIEDESGAAMADSVLKVFGAISRWHHQRDESYRPPLTTGMWRVSGEERHRKRILSDDEIRAIWNCDGGSYAALVKLALLTAQRSEKVRTLRWADIGDGVWIIRTEAREKRNAGSLRLPRLAMDIITAQPRLNEFVFPGRGDGAIASLGTHKAKFDKLCRVKDWRFHDLRRTARSLMSRAGVQREIAERVLGHAQDELIEIYDRHHYQDEMALALEKLAALLEQIVNPPAENVVAPR